MEMEWNWNGNGLETADVLVRARRSGLPVSEHGAQEEAEGGHALRHRLRHGLSPQPPPLRPRHHAYRRGQLVRSGGCLDLVRSVDCLGWSLGWVL